MEHYKDQFARADMEILAGDLIFWPNGGITYRSSEASSGLCFLLNISGENYRPTQHDLLVAAML